LQIVYAFTRHCSFETCAGGSGDTEGALALRRRGQTQGTKMRQHCREFRIGQSDTRHAAARHTRTDGRGEFRIAGGSHSCHDAAGELAAICIPTVTDAAASLENLAAVGRILRDGRADRDQIA
jgi:hypothetical protein